MVYNVNLLHSGQRDDNKNNIKTENDINSLNSQKKGDKRTCYREQHSR